MDETVLPAVGTFSGEDSDGAPAGIDLIAWETSTTLRVHTSITFETTLVSLTFDGATQNLRSLAGRHVAPFTLEPIPVC